MRLLTLFALTALFAQAQPNSNNFNVIVQPDNTEGFVKFWGQKMPSGFKVSLGAPAALTADYTMLLPDTPQDGFIYYDSMTGLLSFTGAGTCGVDCMTLTTNQTAAGIKTFQNGLILEGTTYVAAPHAIQVGSAGGVGCLYSAGDISCTNGSGVQRVLITQGSGSSTVSGTIRTFNATDAINSIDPNGIFSAVAFTVGTFASKITIIDAAGLVTPVSFQLTAGATNGFCLVSDAAGVGTWQACSAGGSFVTTNTAQTGLTGTKEWNSNHTHNAHILTGAVDTYDIGAAANPWRYYFGQTANVESLELATPGFTHAVSWKIHSPLTAAFAIDSSTAVRVLSFASLGTTDNQWNFRGTLLPYAAPSGNDGDIGKSSVGCGQCWRDAYFSGTVNGLTFAGTNYTGNNILLSGINPFLDIGAGRMTLNTTVFRFLDSTLANAQVLISSGGGSGSGIVATGSNTGTFHNRLDSNGILTNVGYFVGPFGGSTQVISNGGDAYFVTLRVSSGASAGYVLTGDASGNATWQAPASGSFVTTNTNQTGLSGTKEWSSLHTFTGGVAVRLGSTARYWGPESDVAYDLGGATFRWNNVWGHTFYTKAGSFTVQNSAGTIDRLFLGQGGVSYADAAGTTVGTLTTSGFNTTQAYSISGTTAIDSNRFGYFPQIGNASSRVVDYFGETIKLYTSGGINTSQILSTGLNWYNTAGFPRIVFFVTTNVGSITSFTTSGDTVIDNNGVQTFAFKLSTGAVNGYCLTSSAVGVGTWQACPGAITNYITTNSAQTGLTGSKSTSGTWTFTSGIQAQATSSARDWQPEANNTYSLGSTSLRWANSYITNNYAWGGSYNVYNSAGSILRGDWLQGGLALYDSGGNLKITLQSAGGVVANGSTAISSTFTVKNSAGANCTITTVYGWVTATTC